MTPLTKAEVLAKCSAAEIASRNETAIATTVNVGRTTTRVVPVADVEAYLHTHNLWLAVEAAAAGTPSAAQMSALALVKFASSRVANMDTTLPIIAAQLGYLVAGNVIAQADRDAIISMGTVPDPVTSFQVAQVLESM